MPFCPKSGSDSQGKRESVAEGGGVSEANIETRFDKLARYNEYYDWTRLRREVVFIEMRFDKLARYNEYYDWTRLRREVAFIAVLPEER